MDGKIREQPRISDPIQNFQKAAQVISHLRKLDLRRIYTRRKISKDAYKCILYLIDFNYYEIYEEQLMGLKYKKTTKSVPEPEGFYKFFECDSSAVLTKEERLFVEDIVYMISAVENSDDIRPIRCCFTSLKKFIVGDIPYLVALLGSELDYEAVFYRTPRNYPY